jgi:acetyl-CoA acetyltransferase
MSLRNRAAIVGIGESDIGRQPGMTGLGLNAQAARRALDDAGLRPQDIDGLLTAYTLTEPHFMLGTVLCEYLGLTPDFCASIVAGGATPAIMIGHAAAAIAGGQANTVLVLTGENRASGQSRDRAVAALASAFGHPYFEYPYGPSIPGCYAMIARRYMHEHGTTRRQMAQVAVTTRRHACLHPNSHMREPIGIDDVLTARPIAEPLTLLDCCLISDAAGAVIVTRPDRATHGRRPPVWLHGIGEAHTHEYLLAAPSLAEFGSVRSGALACAMAGVTPGDIDVAQLYDCFTIVPIIELEELGFVPRGAGGEFWEAGEAGIGGSLPVNTHGGMLSHAHAGAAGGMFGIIEAVAQLRGGLGPRQVDEAALALVHNEGGVMSSHCTLILGRERR